MESNWKLSGKGAVELIDNKPVLLDIGCCQGSATYGYQEAGFYVIGVDINKPPLYRVNGKMVRRYPGEEFIQADGIQILERLARTGSIWLRGRPAFRPAAIHTSWPCQGYTECQRIQGNEHPKLIEPARELLQRIGLPYVQENVDSADTRKIMVDPIMICGASFRLRTYRHRLFESNVQLVAPEHPEHVAPQRKMGRPFADHEFYQAVGNFSGVNVVREDLGLHWMNRDGLRECIPWQYAEHVGLQLMKAIR